MNKILLFLIFTSNFIFSQETSYSAKLENSARFQENKDKGIFNFVFPKEISNEEIKKNATYYTTYFEVKHKQNNGLVTIKMHTNDSPSRRIIKRFLISNNIKRINIDNKEYTIDEFYNEFLK